MNDQNPSTTTSADKIELASDLLTGADAIGAYLFGDHPSRRRKVYHLVRSSRVPVARIGSRLVARRSVLKAWIERQEETAMQLRK